MDLRARVTELGKIERAPAPVVTVYLNTRWADEHQRDRVFRNGVGIDPRRAADRDTTTRGRGEVDVVRARAPDRDHLQAGTRAEHRVREAGVGADVDGNRGVPDAARELRFVLGAARGVDAHRPQRPGTLVGFRPFEDRREIVRHHDRIAVGRHLKDPLSPGSGGEGEGEGASGKPKVSA